MLPPMPSLPTYGAVARTFHWGIAGLLLLQIPLPFICWNSLSG